MIDYHKVVSERYDKVDYVRDIWWNGWYSPCNRII